MPARLSKPLISKWRRLKAAQKLAGFSGAATPTRRQVRMVVKRKTRK